MLKIKNKKIGEGCPKVCVPIVSREKEALIQEAKEYVENGVDIIEWRIDYLDNINDTAFIVETAGMLQKLCGETLLLVTYRSNQQGGEGKLSDEELFKLLEKIAESKSADLLDVELLGMENGAEVIGKLRSKGQAVIASHHNFGMTPENEEMLEILNAMKEAGADIVKLAVMPNTLEDVTRLLAVTASFKEENVDKPLVTMSMGAKGLVSRLSGQIFGSDITFGAGKSASAPGQMNYKSLMGILGEIDKSIQS